MFKCEIPRCKLCRALQIKNAIISACVLGSAALVMSCAVGGPGPTPKASVLTLETGLTGLELAAKQYVLLPRCGAAIGPICSEPATVTAVKAYSEKAYLAVTRAQVAVDVDPSASSSAAAAYITDATAAVAALQDALPAAKGN